MSRGVVVINVCNDISKFAEDYERIEAIKQAIIDTYIKSLKIGTIITPSTYNASTTVRDSVFKLVCKVPNFAIKFELWIK